MARKGTLTERAPWDAEGISRRSWYRRRHRPFAGKVPEAVTKLATAMLARSRTPDDPLVREACLFVAKVQILHGARP